jgi:hypothetical protein
MMSSNHHNRRITVFVTTDPATMAFTSAVVAMISTLQASADGAAAGVHGALIPPSLDPTAMLSTAVHQLDHLSYQINAGVGTANEAGIATVLGTSSATYVAGEVANIGALL